MQKIDWQKVRQTQQTAEIVLSYDLEKLRRLGEGKRIGLWNSIEENQSSFEQELVTALPRDVRDEVSSKFTLAKLLLATAACANGEENKMTTCFSDKEVSLLRDFERYNVFDVLSVEEIVDRITRRGDIYHLAKEFCQKEYSKLDSILDDPEIQRDLKLAFNKRYRSRLDKVARGIKAFVDKHGPLEAAAKIATQAQNELEKTKEEEIKVLRDQLVTVTEDLHEEKARGKLREKEIAERLKQIDAVAEGKLSRFVVKSDARLCELNFIARFDTKMQTFPVRLYSPLEKKVYKVRAWGEGDHTSSPRELSSDMPCNAYSRYVVRGKSCGLFGKRVVKMVIEAVCFNHLEEFQKYGFDTRQADLSDFLDLVAKFIDQAELGKYLHVIGLASPTGWDDKVANEVKSTSFAHNYVSRFVSFCLVDSISGDVIYNPTDGRVVGFIDFFKPEFGSEKLERVRNCAIDRLRVKGYVVLDDVVAETGESRTLINKAFYDLERERRAKVRHIEDVGLVLQKRD